MDGEDVGDSGGSLKTGWCCPRPLGPARGRPEVLEESAVCSFSNLWLVLASFFLPLALAKGPYKHQMSYLEARGKLSTVHTTGTTATSRLTALT